MKCRTSIIAAVLVLPMMLPVLSGCAGGQFRNAAIASMELASRTNRTVVTDLGNIGKQQALNNAAAKIKTAQDTAARQKVLEDMANTWEKIGWLQIQYERAESLNRMAKIYVWSRESWLSLFIREIQEARAKVKAEKEGQ